MLGGRCAARQAVAAAYRARVRHWGRVAAGRRGPPGAMVDPRSERLQLRHGGQQAGRARDGAAGGDGEPVYPAAAQWRDAAAQQQRSRVSDTFAGGIATGAADSSAISTGSHWAPPSTAPARGYGDAGNSRGRGSRGSSSGMMRVVALVMLVLAWAMCGFLYARLDAPASATRAKLLTRITEVTDARKASAAELDAKAAAVESANDAERAQRKRTKGAQDDAATHLRRLEELQRDLEKAQSVRTQQMEVKAAAGGSLGSVRRHLAEEEDAIAAAHSERSTSLSSASAREFARRESHVHLRTAANDGSAFVTEVVSWAPRAVIYRNFISKAERAHIEDLVAGHLSRSKVVSDDENKAVDRSRTSSGVFLVGGLRDEVVLAIEERIANATHTPRDNGEGMYYLRYEHDQQYEPHTDYCYEDPPEGQPIGSGMATSCLEFMRRGKDRWATFLFYIKSPDRGGETAFAHADPEGLPVNYGIASAGEDAPTDLPSFHRMMLPANARYIGGDGSATAARDFDIRSENKRQSDEYWKDWCTKEDGATRALVGRARQPARARSARQG